MAQRKRAGQPKTAKRPAGAPESASAPAGAPKEDESAARDDRKPPAAPEAERAQDASAEAVEEDLDALLADVRHERDEYLALAQRTKADFENYRRRASRETEDAERRGKSALAQKLVPVLDNLERALRSAGVDPEAEEDGSAGGDGGGLAHGVRLVYADLRATLESAGVESYDPIGAAFDPEWHEALSTRPGEGVEPGTVLETVEKGYRLDGQVLRPARVVVSAEQ